MNITPHPVIPIPTDEELEFIYKEKGDQGVFEFLQAREQRIEMAVADPLNHGFELDHWKEIDAIFEKHNFALALGGNRSGKTRKGAHITVKTALENPNAQIVCFAQDSHASVRVQQRAIYDLLPPLYKQKTKTDVGYINYTQKNGFTGESLILPNGSEIFFHTYSQFHSMRSKFEGYSFGSPNPGWVNLGMWLDEYLENGDLLEALKFRIIDMNAKVLLTFTPIDGYTPFVASYLKNAQTIKTRPAELLNNEQVPYVQVNKKMDAGIVYFHTELNKFTNYNRIKKELEGSPRERILTRAYGVPVKSITCLFPLFNTTIHVIDDLPKMSRESHTIYQVVDPAGNRNYSSIWAAVDKSGCVTIIREWPDLDSYGHWAELGEKWRPGPASKKIGYDIQGYIDLFREIEEEMGVSVFERIGDSRYFARENENNIDLFESFSNKGMFFVPSSGQEIDTGLSSLDEWFKYNPNLPVDQANKPILQIHKSCGNLIDALLNWSNNGKKDEALKDFVDLLRYLRMHNDGYGPDFIDASALQTTRVGKGGY